MGLWKGVTVNYNGNIYTAGDIISNTKCDTFDLLDKSNDHFYIVTRLNNGY